MLKKILLVTLLALPFGMFAQDKIAYFNSSEVILNMPEYKQMQDSLKHTYDAIKADIATMEEEYSRKYEAFMKEGENMIETIKIRRMQEIRDLEQRAANYNEQSQQMIQQLQEQLLVPIQQRVKDAIQSVGNENGYTYILDAASLLFVGPAATNATDLVKKKLGL